MNAILDFSKIEAGRLQLEMHEFPLVHCLEESVKLFGLRSAEKNINLSLNVEPGLPEFAFGDMERLRQIMQNLLSNALKFTDEGAVTVSVRSVAVGRVDLKHCSEVDRLKLEKLDPEKELLELCVKDSGIGIPTEHQHLLFQAFSQVDASTTRKYEGTGLGLVICKRLIDAMGGCIWVESEDGAGAEFRLVIPMRLIPGRCHLPGEKRVPGEFESYANRKLASQYPLDILIVGTDASTDSSLQSCRACGYAPHHSADYDLEDRSFGHRDYDLLLVALDKELKALDLVRKVSRGSFAMRPEAIIGFGAAAAGVSSERCRLSGLKEVFEDAPDKEKLEVVIRQVMDARD